MDSDTKKAAGKQQLPGIFSEDRPQPHDIDAEKAILAALLKEPVPCIDQACEMLGSADVFYSPVYRSLFTTIARLYNENDRKIDVITVADALRKEGKLDEIGGTVFLAELMGTIATTAGLESWCELVKEYSILRNVINVCVSAVTSCYSADSEVLELVDKIEGDIFNVRNTHVKDDIMSIQESMTETFAKLQKILKKEVEVGIPTHYPDLDKLIVGLKPGEMIVLAARPSIGKTTFALNLLRNVAMTERNRAVAFFSLEMTADQITRKLLCAQSGVAESSFYDGSFKDQDMHKLTKAVSRFQQAKIYIDPTAGLSTSELRAKARRLKAMYDIEVIIIDYLQLMRGSSRESRQQEVAEISNTIKKLAKDLEVPVIVLAQLNREVEKTGGAPTRPKLSNLRESGAIEQDADIVMFLHRDRDKAKDVTKEDMIAGLDSELIIEKNRNGQIGICHLAFHPHLGEFRTRTRFSDADRPEPENS